MSLRVRRPRKRSYIFYTISLLLSIAKFGTVLYPHQLTPVTYVIRSSRTVSTHVTYPYSFHPLIVYFVYTLLLSRERARIDGG